MATSTIKQVINNSDNGYCKMPDGTLIQWGITPASEIQPNNYGTYAVTFDQPFISKPAVFGNTTGGSYTPKTEITGPNVNYIDTIQASFRVRNDYSSNLSVSIAWFAIGRWK